MIASVARAFWLVVQSAASVIHVVRCACTRRHAIVVFTHFHDIDGEGKDRQMGPLLDALVREKRRFVEIAFVPLSGATLRHRGFKRRSSVSHAFLLVLARFIAPLTNDPERRLLARTRVASVLLRLLRPRAVIIIDESGSGQPLVRAARRLGIKSIAIQHGDFQPGNRQYDPEPGRSFKTEPADVFCLWSPWFRERLLACSPIYTAGNTVVTGRLRYPSPPRVPAVQGLVRVLVVEDADAEFRQESAPFLEALRVALGFRIAVLAHPSAPRFSPGASGALCPSSLATALSETDLVLGIRSSALIEALSIPLPVVAVAASPHAAWLPTVADPLALAARCRDLVSAAHRGTFEKLKELLWAGPSIGDPETAILSFIPTDR